MLNDLFAFALGLAVREHSPRVWRTLALAGLAVALCVYAPVLPLAFLFVALSVLQNNPAHAALAAGAMLALLIVFVRLGLAALFAALAAIFLIGGYAHAQDAGRLCFKSPLTGKCAEGLPYVPPFGAPLEGQMESWIAVKTGYRHLECDLFMFQHGRCL
jgi:hypothetical protein